MKKMILIFFLFLVFKHSYSQEGSKYNINFIVMIDDKIPFQGNLSVKFCIEDATIKDTAAVQYIPGNIAINDTILKRVQSNNVKDIVLLMSYTKVCMGKTKTYNYQIEFRKSWLNQSFTILRIYNLDKKENRKIFFPLNGGEYTYEVDTPTGSQMRIRKRNVKPECK